MKDKRIVIVGVVIAVLIAGVSIVVLGERNIAGGSDILSVPEVITEGEVTSDVIQETAVDVARPATVTVQSEQVVPTPRTGLEATDPGSVNLLSGNVQLVEAFAFW